MDINDVHQQMQDAIQTAHLTKPVWQGLLDAFKRRRNLQSNEPVDNQELVQDLLRENVRDTVESLELTTEAASHILGPGFESEDVLDPTWQKRWITGVTNVSADDEERRTWWARLLAGELQNSGSYSLRTLNIMDTLSIVEARLFSRFCSCVWRSHAGQPIVLMPSVNVHEGETWGMTPREADTLAETGLVSTAPLGYNLPLTKHAAWMISNPLIDIVLVPDADTQLPSTIMDLTTAGREVLNLVEIVPDRAYLQQTLIKLKECGKVYHAVRTPSGWRRGTEVVIGPDENSLS